MLLSVLLFDTIITSLLGELILKTVLKERNDSVHDVTEFVCVVIFKIRFDLTFWWWGRTKMAKLYIL